MQAIGAQPCHLVIVLFAHMSSTELADMPCRLAANIAQCVNHQTNSSKFIIPPSSSFAFSSESGLSPFLFAYLTW